MIQTISPVLPGALLCMLGGGQLGRMFTLAAHAMGYRVMIVDPDPKSPAGAIADIHLCTAYDHPETVTRIKNECAAATTEFENIPAGLLAILAEVMPVAPGAEAVRIAQDRRLEKQSISHAGLRVAPWCAIEKSEDLSQDFSAYLPGILKTARFGYDGKGQINIEQAEDLASAWSALQQQPCILEKRLELQCELSVMVVRNYRGEADTYPVSMNHHRNGILDVSIVPAPISAAQADQVRAAALQLANALHYEGVLGVECFLLADDSLLINEIAPRPHNSGHYTQDACISSQFEQQVRMMCGLPPASTRLLSPVVMVNILGDVWRQGEPAWQDVLQQTNLVLHLYGKQEARPGRKMGHFNMVADTLETAMQDAERIRGILGIA